MRIRDIVFFPLRILLKHNKVEALGLTSLIEERSKICKKYVQTPVLDIACGEENYLIKKLYVKGYGLDIFPFNNIDICGSAEALPFKDNSFKSVTIIGSINYLKNYDIVLKEIQRIIGNEGLLLITNTNEFFSKCRHYFASWKNVQTKINQGQRYGFPKSTLMKIFETAGFEILDCINYFMGISQLYILKTRKK